MTLPDKDILASAETIAFLQQFKAVGAISRRLQKLFIPYLPNIFYLKAGVDIVDFTERLPVDAYRNKLRIGWAGSLVNQPGNRSYEKILLPLKNLYSDIFDFHFCIEGVNGLPFNQMSNFYNEIDLYLCTSRSEGASTPIREALACGRPIVTMQIGDTPELIISDVNGWFIKSYSLESTISILIKLHTNRSCLQKVVSQTRKSILNNWTWEKVAPNWIEAFYSVKNDNILLL